MDRGLREVLSTVRENYQSVNWWRNRVLVPFVFGTATRYHPKYPGYENAVRVMEEDWDTLIVLDACRADYFEKVADLDRFDQYDNRISLGSHSSEWTRRNFEGEQFGDTVYVSANPHTSLVAGGSFHYIYELWETDVDEEYGVVRPEAVRDTAIEARQRFHNKRLIVHFMQPHGPYLGSDIGNWNTDSKYWQAYEDNLEYVLTFVEELIAENQEKTIITADHGQTNFDGLKDRLGLSGHPPRTRFRELVEVPWAVVDGDRREIQSDDISEVQGEQVEDRLKDLGYL